MSRAGKSDRKGGGDPAERWWWCRQGAGMEVARSGNILESFSKREPTRLTDGLGVDVGD